MCQIRVTLTPLRYLGAEALTTYEKRAGYTDTEEENCRTGHKHRARRDEAANCQ